MAGADFRVHRLSIPKTLDELMDLGTDSLNAPTTHQIKGDVIAALGPKWKHERMRGPCGKELKDISLQQLLKLFKRTFLPPKTYFTVEPSSSISDKKITNHWTRIGKKLVNIGRKCEFGRITRVKKHYLQFRSNNK